MIRRLSETNGEIRSPSGDANSMKKPRRIFIQPENTTICLRLAAPPMYTGEAPSFLSD